MVWKRLEDLYTSNAQKKPLDKIPPPAIHYDKYGRSQAGVTFTGRVLPDRVTNKTKIIKRFCPIHKSCLVLRPLRYINHSGYTGKKQGGGD